MVPKDVRHSSGDWGVGMDVWFPVLEANQGTLTLGAILIALVLALWEQRLVRVRAEREENTERDDVVAWIDDLKARIMVPPAPPGRYAKEFDHDELVAYLQELDAVASKVRSPLLARRVIALKRSLGEQYERYAADYERWVRAVLRVLDDMRWSIPEPCRTAHSSAVSAARGFSPHPSA